MTHDLLRLAKAGVLVSPFKPGQTLARAHGLKDAATDTINMSMARPTKRDVIKATQADLDAVLHWLKCEYEVDHDGLWSNENIIRDSFKDDHLWVIRRDGMAVALQVGDCSPDIFCVRKDCQKQGLGTALLEALIDRAMLADILVLFGVCSPRTSLPFWEKHGFERYGNMGEVALVNVRLLLPSRSVELPRDLPKVDVVISFYPEAAIHKQANVEPWKVYPVRGARDVHGTVWLEHCVVGLEDVKRGQCLAVKIEIEGIVRYFGEANCSEANAAGVEKDQHGVFYVEWILPATVKSALRENSIELLN